MSAVRETFPSFSVSHVGLFVFDLDMMTDFYVKTFGFEITDRGVVRESSRIVFMSRDPKEHHQIVLVEGRTAPAGTDLINQISFRVDSLDALRRVKQIVEADGRDADLKPANHGNAFSIYFRDPEGNRFEVFADTPYYVEQAVVDPLELAQPDDVILDGTRSRYGDRPSFQPVEQWRAAFARRLANSTVEAESGS